ncbi:MAG: ATP-binding protein [Patescibacteria group bacterium]
MIKRTLLPKLIAHLDNPEISLIVGPRQAGKTTLMGLLIDHLKSQGKNSLFLNYDLDSDRPYFKSQTDLVGKIRLEIGNTGYVFLDEIQRKDNAGLFLKGLSDMNLPYKFVVSGSGSLELKEKIAESLAGRKRIFTLNPLSFEEFINFKTQYHYEEKLVDYLKTDPEGGQKLLKEYLSFGGYPKVVTFETTEEKLEAIKDIFESYLEKDILGLLNLKRTENFSNLVRTLSSQMGKLINYSELSSTLGITERTVKHYIWYLTKTFVGDKISPFTHRLRKEIVKSPVFYFTDTGLANFATRDFYMQDFSTLGFHFQNLVYHELKNLFGDVHYWRTKDGAEVDFVIDNGRSPVPIEVKLQTPSESKIPNGLISFINKYNPPKAYVVNLSYQGKTTYNKTVVSFIPYYSLKSIL